jgi:hypothetical protein
MESLIALLSIVVLALLIVQLGTNALLLTGMTLPVARFQAASAFFGVGFTTREAELVVNHPVRRRVILHLIVAGNIGLTSALATLIVTFVNNDNDGGVPHGMLLVLVLLGGLLLAAIFNLPFVKKPLDLVMRRSLESAGIVRAVDYELLLKVREGYCVSDLEISAGHPLAGKKLWESRPSDQGIVVLGIYHRGEEFEGAPGKNAVVEAGDTLMVYGSEEDVAKLVRGNPRPDDALDKLDERATKVD